MGIDDLSNLRSGRTLTSFVLYCIAHPEERFWQALRNWCGYAFVYAAHTPGTPHDTFSWEERYG